jgi:hypothetical protein
MFQSKVQALTNKQTNKKPHLLSIFSFLTYKEFCVCESIMMKAYINTTGATSGAGTAPPFRSTWVHALVFSGVRVTWSLVLYVCFVDRRLSFCILSFGPCVVCSSSIYGFWLPLWYLQTLFIIHRPKFLCPKMFPYMFHFREASRCHRDNQKT